MNYKQERLPAQDHVADMTHLEISYGGWKNTARATQAVSTAFK